MLQKRKRCGFGGKFLNFLQSFLSHRIQFVEFQSGKTSELHQSDCGVPQGSAHGPLLFLIYINNMPQIFEICEDVLVADDTTIFGGGNSLSQALSSDLVKAQNCFDNNKLTIKVDKCCKFNFGSGNRFSAVVDENLQR